MPEAGTPEQVVRAYYDAYSHGRPERFEDIVATDYVDHGHTPPGHGPQGARDDYAQAVQKVGGIPTYTIDALLSQDDTVAVVWTGSLPDGSQLRGLSLYLVRDERIAEVRHTALGTPPG